MSEIFTVHESQERRIQDMQPYLERELHGQQIDIDLSVGPLMSHSEAVDVYGINGDILATITLPSETEAKEIAIVDYGEPDQDNPRPITIYEGQPIPMMGRARERYGLRALNYTPEQHMSTHVGFPEGAALSIGRSESRDHYDANYKLGLNEDSRENMLISRNHATVTIENGKLSIIDHSTNGSLVRSANPERAEALSTVEKVHAVVGHNALQGAEIQQPVREIYASLADTANTLSQGYIEPSILVHKMQRILETMPAAERELLGDLTELVNGITDEYGRETDRSRTSSIARRISKMSRERMGGL